VRYYHYWIWQNKPYHEFKNKSWRNKTLHDLQLKEVRDRVSKTFDRYTGVIFLMIGLSFMTGSKSISESSYGSTVGPDIFPFWLGLILSLLSVRLLYETFFYHKKGEEKSGFQLAVDYKRFSIIFITAFFYCLFLEEIGYVIGTFIFLLVGFQTIQKGKWMVSILISLTFSFSIYYIYVKFLQGTLPGFPVWLG
jgi:putative tricarboxylic transport membrane protein